jgi:hypothetical protein
LTRKATSTKLTRKNDFLSPSPTLTLLLDTLTRLLFEGWKATLRVKGRPKKTVEKHERIHVSIAE